jgi:hypothetical protein
LSRGESTAKRVLRLVPCLRIRQVPAGRPGGEMKIANRRCDSHGCDSHVLSTPVVKVDPMNIDGGMEAGGCAEPRAAS